MFANSRLHCIGLILFGSSSVAWGLGLGEIQLHSYLNEPFSAQAPLLELNKLELHDIQVRLAGAEEFEKAGIERPYYLSQIQYQVTQDTKGNPIIQFSSQVPLSEPFMTLLVEADWQSGRVLKEYTILLDPPKVASRAHAAISKVALPSSKPEQSIKTSSSLDSLTPGSAFGPTTSTDTLWRISSRVTKDNTLSVYQAMIAILKKNPNAFLKQNTNGLMQGQTLQLPSEQEMSVISASEAEALVKEYTKAWSSGGNAPELPMATTQASLSKGSKIKQTEPPLKLVTSTKPFEVPEASTVAVEADTSVAEAASSETPSTEVDPVLTSSKPSATAASMGSDLVDVKLLSNRLNLMEEALDTLKKVNQDLLGKQEILQQQNESLTKLLTLRDEELSKLLTQIEKKEVPEQLASVKPETIVMPAATMIPPKPVVVEPIIASEGMPIWGWIILMAAVGGSGLILVLRSKKKLDLVHVGDTLVQVKEEALNYFQAIKSRSKSKSQEKDQVYPDVHPQISTFSQPTQKASIPPDVDASKQLPETSFDIDEAIAAFSEDFDQKLVDRQKPNDDSEDENRRNIMSDIDIYLTYERFGLAEELIKNILKQYQNFWPAKLKELELYLKMNRRQEISKWIEALPADFNQKYQNIWQEAVNLLKPLQLKKLQPGQPIDLPEQKNESSYGEIDFQYDTASAEEIEPIVVSEKTESDSSQWEVTTQFTLEGAELKEDLHSVPIKGSAEDEVDHQDDAITKLELAKAYIQMDDLDGAKVLLEEVLKIGNADQIAQAGALLKQC
ncbi:MAG: FimV/HubP family polar landmark protein [Gammaproteobacteria bacterium]